jgi:hypothetical protein
MIGMDRHCQIVGASLSGERPVDERTHESIAVLSERLERSRRSSPLLAGVTFSPYAERLRQRAEAVAVG